ncbi:MAG: DUF502 domain-containing protein [Phycisphaeraceae bacterium]|nr:DUF502 domain-containing protein [Phycisphaeraceae bacterium]
MAEKTTQLGLLLKFRKYLLAGLLTILPIWVTWMIVRFLLELFSNSGKPLIQALSGALADRAPAVSRWLDHPAFQSFLAVTTVVALLLAIGWFSTVFLGRKMLALFDSIIERIPLIKTIYGATKNLISSLQQKPDGVQRVVLIDFPSAEMKTVGLVTRTFKDSETGRELAAVYVPTTPNPTSGYLEIVPIDKVTSTPWTVDEAMTFIVSGGATAPKTIVYDRGVEPTAPVGTTDTETDGANPDPAPQET